jgi:DNA polymerase-3 subunit gamma/tau
MRHDEMLPTKTRYPVHTNGRGALLQSRSYPLGAAAKQGRAESLAERARVSLSLYRRWRPKTFHDLVGQDAVVRTLQTALSSGKLAHAYLFSGPRGSGKTSAAKILARCIECESGPAPEPDNTCENCLAILAGTALDVQEVDAASNRGIEEIRTLRESVKFAPAVMRAKVFIIDEAHMLTREGANAFLKTLEEPPPHAIFILATTAPEALPPTILSRCQRYAFRRIPIVTMIERMREIAGAEGIAIGDDALGAIAYRADGGLRDALTMLEQVAAFAGDGAIDALTVEAAFGTTGRAHARTLADALLAGDAGLALRTIDAASDAGTDMTGLTRTAIGEFRNLLVGRIDPDLLARDLSPEDAERAKALSAATPQARTVRALRLLADALAAGRQTGNPRLELETATLRFILQAEDPTLEALAARVAALETGDGAPPVVARATPPAAARPAPPAQPDAPPRAEEPPAAAPPERPQEPAAARPAPGPPARPPESGPPTLQRVRSMWDQIRTRVYEGAMPLKAPLSRATVESLEGNVLTVRLVDAFQEEWVRERVSLIEAALEELLGAPLRVVITSGAAGGARAPRGAAQRSGHAAGDPAHRPAASADDAGGEPDLLAYARIRLAAPSETESA